MKYDKLPNIKILDESNKVIHQKSSDVTFPLKEETKKLIMMLLIIWRWVKLKNIVRSMI